MTKEEKTIHYQTLRSDTLKMAITILDAKVQRDIENQKLLPPGRQSTVHSYSAEDVCSEASQLFEYLMNTNS
jgi:hypothetical protein